MTQPSAPGGESVPLSTRFIAALAYAYLSFVWLTTRLRIYGEEHRAALRRADQHFIYALWHNRQVFFTCTHRDQGASIMVSRSRDGEIIARVMEFSRIRASRGSSSRGASAALRDMMKIIRSGYDIGLTPDGPKGPVYEAKPGALFLAQKLGVPILPIINSLSRKLVLKKSWDDFQVPLPFGRAVIRYAAPITVGPEDDLQVKAQELKRSLDAITALADAEVEPARPSRPKPAVNWPLLAASNALAPIAAAGVVIHFALSGRRGVLQRLPQELRNRCGLLSAVDHARLAGRPVLWIHAASAGEAGAAHALLERLGDFSERPAVLMTTMTSAGRDTAERLSGVDVAAVAPLDSIASMTTFLKSARPYALVLVETELWPNMIELSHHSGLRIGMINGRVSAKSHSRYRWIRPFIGPLLGRIGRLAVQTPEDARRFIDLGAAPGDIKVTGNLKHDQRERSEEDAEAAESLRRLGWEGKPLFVAGSTHPEEEEILISAFLEARQSIPEARLLIAPRHIERASDAESSLRRRGLAVRRWSALDLGTAVSPDVLLLDVMGKLGSFYTLAACSFVGGTLIPLGGHNLLEPARACSPVLFGPHTENVSSEAQALENSGGGCRVRNALDLAHKLVEWLGDRACAAEKGRQAKTASSALSGAAEKTFEHLRSILEPPQLPNARGL